MQTQACKNCGTKLIERQTQLKASQLKQPYYYTAYYFCPKCQKIYHNEKFKVKTQQLGFKQSQIIEPQIPPDVDAEIWTDGACVFNGTPQAKAAWSFVSGDHEEAGRVPGVKQTNNVAEGLAVLHAIRWAAELGYEHVRIYTDSQITLLGVKKKASLVKENREIFQQIEQIITAHNMKVFYEKVLGHSGNIGNERADKLANQLAGKK